MNFKKNESGQISAHFSFREMQCRCQRSDCVSQVISEDLIRKLEAVRTAWGKPLKINRGYSCTKHQLSINPKAPNSKHCFGLAVDISDPDGKLKTFLADKLEIFDLYMEHGSATPTWCHLQSVAPGSGRRIFYP